MVINLVGAHNFLVMAWIQTLPAVVGKAVANPLQPPAMLSILGPPMRCVQVQVFLPIPPTRPAKCLSKYSFKTEQRRLTALSAHFMRP